MPMGVYPRPSLQERLMRNTRVTEADCVEWLGPFSPAGYGHIGQRVNGKYRTYRTHRLSFEIANGAIPAGKVIRHKCDNPPCINPNHLELGSDADNIRDRDERDRTARGERSGNSVLTSDQVGQIRAQYEAGGVTQKTLAAQFGVCQAHISKVIRRVNWR